MSFQLPRPWPTNPWTTRFRTVRASPPDAFAPGSRVVTVQSPALGGRGDLIVHTPSEAPLPDDVPVVVLLHGVYGSFWNWTLNGGAHLTLDRLVHQGSIGTMVLVTPSDGLAGEGTAYLPHQGADYEAWIVEDVVDCVRELVDAVSDSSPVFLGGNSMGGFGAARLGLRHHSIVSGIAMHSAITHLDQLAQFTVGDVADRAHLDDGGDLTAAFASCQRPPPVYLDCGTRDPLSNANRDLHDALIALGVEHRYHEFDGGHDWDAWTARVEHSFAFFDTIANGAPWS